MASQKVTPFLWFKAGQAEEAARFYVSLLDGSRVLDVNPMVTTFELAGQRYSALNGNPGQPFTEAFSLMVECVDQPEVDRLWDTLTSNGGKPGRCGWCTDKFGVSWQIIPRALMELLGERDPQKAARVREAMLAMNKIDVAALRRAHAGT